MAIAVDAAGEARRGDVTELTGLLDLAARPVGMRVILRRERPHPGSLSRGGGRLQSAGGMVGEQQDRLGFCTHAPNPKVSAPAEGEEGALVRLQTGELRRRPVSSVEC